MKTSSLLVQKFIFPIFIGMLFYGCDPESSPGPDPGPGPLETIFFGIFDNEWEVEGVDNYFIGIFRDGAEDTSSGELRGFEDHPDLGFSDMVNGTFDGLDIEFTIARDDGANNVVFSGTMTPTSETDHNIIRIDLTTSENETLVLTID